MEEERITTSFEREGKVKGDLTLLQMSAETFSKLAVMQSLCINLRESSHQGQVALAKPGYVA